MQENVLTFRKYWEIRGFQVATVISHGTRKKSFSTCTFSINLWLLKKISIVSQGLSSYSQSRGTLMPDPSGLPSSELPQRLCDACLPSWSTLAWSQYYNQFPFSLPSRKHFFLIALLKHNSHTIKPAHLKCTCTTQWFLLYSKLCNHHYNRILEHFYHQSKRAHTH